MVKREIIRKHLEKLDKYLTQLRRLQKYPLETFLHDPDIHASAERYLQLAIETTISMGNHVIADLNLGYANWLILNKSKTFSLTTSNPSHQIP